MAFFGTDDFAVPTLTALHQSMTAGGRVQEIQVVHPADRPRGRGKQVSLGAVAATAERLGLPRYPVDCDFRMNGWELPDPLADFDLGVVVSFGYMLPARVIQAFPAGIINVHGSLLPKYRGASPIQTALMNNEPETGVSIVEVMPRAFDSGRVLTQRSLPLRRHQVYHTVRADLSRLGAELLVETVERLEECRADPVHAALDLKAADKGRGLDAPKLPGDIGLIHWSELEAEEVVHRWRGLKGWRKVYTYWDGRRQILQELQTDFTQTDIPEWLQERTKSFTPGDVLLDRAADRLLIRCKEGWISVLMLLPDCGSKDLTAIRWAATQRVGSLSEGDQSLEEDTQYLLCARFDSNGPRRPQ